jgi:hypothetical protein
MPTRVAIRFKRCDSDVIAEYHEMRGGLRIVGQLHRWFCA